MSFSLKGVIHSLYQGSKFRRRIQLRKSTGIDPKNRTIIVSKKGANMSRKWARFQKETAPSALLASIIRTFRP